MLVINKLKQFKVNNTSALQKTDRLNQETYAIIGILLAILGYFLVALMGVLQKPIILNVPIIVVIFFQSLIPVILISPAAIKSGLKVNDTNTFFTYFIRISSGLACYAALSYDIRFMTISEALLFQYTASLWIPFISLWWLKVRIEPKLWVCVLLGFLGVSVLLKPQSLISNGLLGIAISCGILQAISVVAIRRLSVTEPISRVIFYYFLIGTIVSFPFALPQLNKINQHTMLFLFGVGLTTFFAQYLITLSLRYAKAVTLAPICYFSILFSGLFDWFIWHKHPSISSLTGMILIVLSGLLVILFSQQKHDAKR